MKKRDKKKTDPEIKAQVREIMRGRRELRRARKEAIKNGSWEDIIPMLVAEENPDVSSYREQLEFHKPITFFVGENGSGKSTLLEAIAVAYGFNPEGGTRNYSFSTYDSHSELCNAMTVIKGYNKAGWDISSEQRAFIMLQQQMMPMVTNGEAFLTDIMKSPMEKAS